MYSLLGFALLEINSYLSKKKKKHSDLPISCWKHAVLHTVALIQIRPSAYHDYSLLQIVRGKEPNISHLQIFGCAVYVPISPP